MIKNVFILAIFSLSTLHAMSSQKKQEPPPDDEQEDAYVEEVDLWYGPGFYYGIWFDDEDDYWEWRGRHRDYPSNRNYYHRERPIEYHDGGGHGGHGGGHGGGHK